MQHSRGSCTHKRDSRKRTSKHSQTSCKKKSNSSGTPNDCCSAGSKSKRPKLLKKIEREGIMKAIADVNLEEFEQRVIIQLSKENEYCREVMQKEIINNLVESKDLFRLLLDHHRTVFISLYEKNSTGKEKYLRFQIEWHKQCSIFLMPKDTAIDCILPDPTPMVLALLKKWMSFCEELDTETCKKVMALLIKFC